MRNPRLLSTSGKSLCAVVLLSALVAAQAPSQLRVEVTASPATIAPGACTPIYAVLKDANGRRVTQAPDGRPVASNSFALSSSNGAAFQWRYGDPKLGYLCALPIASAGASTTVTATLIGYALTGTATLSVQGAVAPAQVPPAPRANVPSPTAQPPATPTISPSPSGRTPSANPVRAPRAPVSPAAAGNTANPPASSGGPATPAAASAGAANSPATGATSAANSPTTSAPSPMVAVYVLPPKTSIAKGSGTDYVAVATDANQLPVAGVSFTWKSSAPAVATISQSGVAAGIALGTTMITATANGIDSAPATLDVVATPVAGWAPGPKPGPCGNIGAVQAWEGSLSVSYSQNASNAAERDQIRRGAATGTIVNPKSPLQVVVSGSAQGGVSWIGFANFPTDDNKYPYTGKGNINDSSEDLTVPPPNVTTLIGNDQLIALVQGIDEHSKVTLNVRYSDCSYNFSFDPVIEATHTDFSGEKYKGEFLVGSVLSGRRSLPRAGSSITGSANFPAHSNLWLIQNGEGDAFLAGLDGLIVGGLLNENNAGSASVVWSLTAVP